MNLWIAACTLGVLAGCAARYTEPPLPPDHPASVEGAAAPVRQRARTLDLAGAEPVRPAEGRPAPNAPGHGAHGEHDRGSQRAPADGARATPGHDHAAAASGARRDEAPGAALYACPMHAAVTSERPGVRCPKCGMALEPREGGDR